jgi:glutamate carboxypeptidase
VEAVHPIRAGAADISFTSGYVEKAMDGIGLSGGNDHTEKEFAEMNRLPDLTKRAAILLWRLNQD